ncbi:hypothetical protein BJ878DRAFT_125854 [Calycina marina]|uniref:Uncharacterized protein n=1 Tax=Calycina marina TaxID=1763456 RepID=A0A9P7Z0C5_9HELO|nr:hypothetical protein BJ878DRAFT_125854 [Calycina marina]
MSEKDVHSPNPAVRNLEVPLGSGTSTADPLAETIPELDDELSQLGISGDKVRKDDDAELSSGSRTHRRGGRKKTQPDVDVENDGYSSTDSRDYQRGGRKQSQTETEEKDELVSDLHMFDRGDKKSRSRRIPPPGKANVPWSERNGRLAAMKEGSAALTSDQTPVTAPQAIDTNAPTSTCPHCSNPISSVRPIKPAEAASTSEAASSYARKPSPSGLGSLFNVKRGDKPGPPIGVYVERDEDVKKNEKKKKKKKKKKDEWKKEEKKRKSSKKKQSKKRSQREEESSDESSPSDSSDSSGDEKEEPKRKPVQIRLDLNLELEVLFKAKIKGDITITFLE